MEIAVAVTHTMKPTLCPACGHTHEACTGVTGAFMPREGSYVVCVGCASILQFGSDLVLRKLDLEDVHPEMRSMLKELCDSILAFKQTQAYRALTRTGNVN